MNDKVRLSGVLVAALITLTSLPSTALAGREIPGPDRFQVDVAGPAGTIAQPAAAHRRIRPGSAQAVPPGLDRVLAEYLELHGQIVDGSMRSPMLPWSAPKSSAN
ncbi:MAG: hypothetical protein ABI794_07560 [Betaproteobacteria bacterium]